MVRRRYGGLTPTNNALKKANYPKDKNERRKQQISNPQKKTTSVSKNIYLELLTH